MTGLASRSVLGMLLLAVLACGEADIAPATQSSDDAVASPPYSQVIRHSGIYRVRGVVRSGSGELVVASGGHSKIMVFDGAGTIVTEFGGHGGAPDEFLTLMKMTPLGGDSLLVWDPAGLKLAVWSTEGDLGRTIRLPSEADAVFVGTLGNGRHVFYRNRTTRPSTVSPWTVYTDSLELFVVTEDPVERSMIGVFPLRRMVAADATALNGPARIAVPLPDGPTTTLAVAENQIYVANPASAEILVLSGDGEARDRIDVPIRSAPRTSEDAEAAVAEALDGVEASRRPGLRRYYERFPQPTRYPAFDLLRTDAAGRIWLRGFPTRSDTVAAWTVIDRRRRSVRVDLPRTFEPYHITRTAATGTFLGPDDVEHVAVIDLPGNVHPEADQGSND